MPMLLDIIQWQWGLSQNPFQSIASYSPTEMRLTYINNVSWYTPNNTVSLEGSASGLVRKGLRGCISSGRQGLRLGCRV